MSWPTDAWANLGSKIMDTVSSVLKRMLPPEKMTEAERAAVEYQVAEAIRNLDWEREKAEIEDRMNARLLAAAELEKGNAWTTTLAAIHRPIWSLSTLLLFAWTIVGESVGLPSIKLGETHKDIMLTVVMFYFGGRSIEKVIAEVQKTKRLRRR